MPKELYDLGISAISIILSYDSPVSIGLLFDITKYVHHVCNTARGIQNPDLAGLPKVIDWNKH